MDTNTAINVEFPENITPVQLNHASRRRRVLAFLTDISILGCIFTLLFAATMFLTIVSGKTLLVILILPLLFMWSAAFILRDVIFGKASLGKRILGIRVVNKETGEPATNKARAIRGFSSLISFFDFLFLLFSRKSLGDRIGATAVVYNKVNESVSADGTVVSSPVKRGGGFAIITVVLSFIIIISIIVTSVIYSMKLIMQKEEYALAVEYIVESSYFETLGIPEDKLEFTGYNYYTSIGVTKATFTFRIDGKDFTDTILIVCVNDNGTWKIDEYSSKIYRDR